MKKLKEKMCLQKSQTFSDHPIADRRLGLESKAEGFSRSSLRRFAISLPVFGQTMKKRMRGGGAQSSNVGRNSHGSLVIKPGKARASRTRLCIPPID